MTHIYTYLPNLETPLSISFNALIWESVHVCSSCHDVDVYQYSTSTLEATLCHYGVLILEETVSPLIGQCWPRDLNTGLWLANTDHVILYSPLIGQCWSRDLNTGLWLIETHWFFPAATLWPGQLTAAAFAPFIPTLRKKTDWLTLVKSLSEPLFLLASGGLSAISHWWNTGDRHSHHKVQMHKLRRFSFYNTTKGCT